MARYSHLVTLGLVVWLSSVSIQVKGQQTCQGVYQVIGTHTACLTNSPAADSVGLTPTDVDFVLQKHNTLRGSVIPTARNMIRMVWNSELQLIAQKWADQCSTAHDLGFDRHVPGRFTSVGQNIAWGYGSWDAAVQGWYNEVNDFNFGSTTQRGEVGHYTQIVWATSVSLGCGYSECALGGAARTPYYVCNYAPGGNMDGGAATLYTPYELGVPCSQCPNSCVDNACVCNKVCYNGGTLNLATCQCACPGTFYDPFDCKLDCTQALVEPSVCTFYTYANCRQFSNVPGDCPLRCQACAAGGYQEPTPTTTTTTTTTQAPLPGSCHPAYATITDHSACLGPSRFLVNEGVTSTSINFIPIYHNFLRGSAQINPVASNMLHMTWDAELAMVAQKWASSCPDSADIGARMRIPGVYPEVGQNAAFDVNDWTVAIQQWYNERNSFVYGGTAAQQTGSINRYTQLVWANAYRIGCGYAMCTGSTYSSIYVCNYAQAATAGDTRPYELGTPCQNCGGVCTDGVCNCNKVCYNGGTLVTSTCTCQCAYSYYNQDDCSLDCLNQGNIQESTSCYGTFPISLCPLLPNVPKECPLMCGGCVGGGILPARVITTTTTTTTTTTIPPTPAPIGCPAEYRAIMGHSRCRVEGSTDPAVRFLRAGVTQADQASITTYHNFRRNFVQPQASDMRTIYWNADLAATAQGWANTCPQASDLAAARVIPGFFPNVGQLVSTTNTVSLWNNVMESWYNQVSNFNYGSTTQNGPVDKYLQMVAAQAYQIGCGFAECQDVNTNAVRQSYVCNYAPANPLPNIYQPYTQGTPCTGCAGTCTQNACDCGTKVCENGGTLTAQCTCSCVMPYHDPAQNCALNCDLAVEDAECGRSLVQAGCPIIEGYRRQCPFLCGICSAPETTMAPTTPFPEPECGCPSVHVTAPGVLRDSVGIYNVQPCKVADRPVYMRSAPTGDRYLYYDEPQGAWVVQTALEGGDTIMRVMTTQQRPYFVVRPWEWRRNNDFLENGNINVECMCGKPICQELEAVSTEDGHVFPANFTYQSLYNDRPFYQMRFRTQVAYLYFHIATDCSFWKVGQVLSMDGVMMAYDVSANPMDIKAPWMVAKSNSLWTEDTSLSFVCRQYQTQ